jgi:Uma2 family endonuclease
MIAPTKSISPARTFDAPRLSAPGEPTWEMAYLFPAQGKWPVDEYLSLDSNWFIEFDRGCVEVLPMPGVFHQRMSRWLVRQLEEYVAAGHGGEVFASPLPVRLNPDLYREPDVIYQQSLRFGRNGKELEGADLVMEIVSEGEQNRHRDLVAKRAEYAAAGIAEYWIIDPLERRVTVLRLSGAEYQVVGEFQSGARAVSALLPGFGIDVAALFSLDPELARESGGA